MNGCFINLQRSSARREAMRAQLRALGLEGGIARLAAVDAAELRSAQALHTVHGSRISAGEHACFLSHLAALEQGMPGSFHLVLEDDALLSPALPLLLRQSDALARLEAFDIVFLECMPYTSAPALLPLWRSLRQHLPAAAGAPREALTGIEILEAKGLYNWGAVAYLATPRGLRILPALLREALAAGPAQALDLTLSQLIEQERLRAAVLAPFLATSRQGELGHSTITDRARAGENDALGGALRRLFFAGPVDGLEAEVAPYRHAPLTDDPQLRLLADLMAQLFVITAREGTGAPRTTP